jgi:hypothetical protein
MSCHDGSDITNNNNGVRAKDCEINNRGLASFSTPHTNKTSTTDDDGDDDIRGDGDNDEEDKEDKEEDDDDKVECDKKKNTSIIWSREAEGGGK